MQQYVFLIVSVLSKETSNCIGSEKKSQPKHSSKMGLFSQVEWATLTTVIFVEYGKIIRHAIWFMLAIFSYVFLRSKIVTHTSMLTRTSRT